MGDSGYAIYRKDGTEMREIYSTEDMLHGFNFPYQVGSRGDDPYEASVETHQVQYGDIVVLASDGLWDNVEKEQVRNSVSQYVTLQTGRLSDLADSLAKLARKVAMDKKADCPFARKARQAGHNWSGGKLDDITVVVAQFATIQSHNSDL